ncbi:MAG: tetratricopeptide repeat protein [Acidobacteriota bacterium]|nr:tetratricopeptide repeat protein [Acidobacteriota bacterium]
MAVQRDKVIASAEKLVAKGKIEPAIKEYERLLEDNPNDVNTLNRIGDLWVRINRNDEAVKVFSKIAGHYSRDGFFLKAIAIYKKINKLDPSQLDIYAKLADLYAKQGLAMEAKSQYQVLADYYIKHGEPANALGIYRKISELDPQSINVHVKLADLYSQNNQTIEALKEYDRVGRMLLKRGMLDEAQQVFRKALKIDPRNTELVDSLVTSLVEAKDFENARQIVEAALEVNADNPRLLAMLGKIQLGRGDTSAARATLERAVSFDPNEASVREALSDLYLRQNDTDRALEMVAPLVERALARGERGAAIEMLNRITRVDPGHTGTLERLVAVYTRLNEETNILASMNSLAEAHIAKTRFEDAAKVLERLIAREPQNAQHRTKLQFVRSQMGGGVDTLPPRKTAADLALEIEEPAPSFDVAEEEPSLTLDLDAAPPVELELELDMPPEPARPAPPPQIQRLMPAVEIAAADLANDGSGGDDLDFITEHLTEAEVFAKYGLAEKAAEHLRAVIDRAPRNMTAHERLFRILLEEGDNAGARTAAQAYVVLLRETGEDATIDAVRHEFVSRGQAFEPAPARAAAPPPVAMPEPSIALDDFSDEPVEELSFDLDAPAPDIEFGLEEPELVAEEPVEEVLELAPEPQTESFVEELTSSELTTEDLTLDDALLSAEELPMAAEFAAAEEFSFGEETPAEPEPVEPVATEEPLLVLPEPEPEPVLELVEPEPAFSFDAPEPLPTFEEEPAIAFDDPMAAFGEEPAAAFTEDPVAAFAEEPSSAFADEPASAFAEETISAFAEEPPAAFAEESISAFAEEPVAAFAEEPASSFAEESLFGGGVTELEELPLEELGEVDFYIEQELFDEARRKLETLSARFPGNSDLEARRARIDAAAAAAAAPRPAVLSRDEIENELLSAIPDDDDDFAIPMAPVAASPEPVAEAPAMTASFMQEENLFADEDNFFDLAAELESELADEEEAISLSEEEQSLEEIFKEFKKGVEQQLDSEDYDTHYNLGIAYKEMGLIDEAIGEFQLASKDPKRAVECASMLGLCFLEKGMPQLAIKWYRKGLEMPEITEEEHVGLLYDLASAYQEVGDTEQAQKAFMEVYGMNSTYRDIVSRIKQLEDSRR